MGFAVKAGAPKPDISSPEALKRTLLNAKSVGYSTQGASGQYFVKVIEQLGIAAEVKAKHKDTAGAVGELVATGAAEIGMRFHAARGSMSVGQSQGGLPPDRVVESEAAILQETQRLIERWHDPARFAMQRVVVAPCSPFSVSQELMRDSAALARALGTRMHTHLAENDHDVAYSQHKFGMTPAEYAESLGWLGDDVWHAHCVKLDAPGIAAFARSGTAPRSLIDST